MRSVVGALLRASTTRIQLVHGRHAVRCFADKPVEAGDAKETQQDAPAQQDSTFDDALKQRIKSFLRETIVTRTKLAKAKSELQAALSAYEAELRSQKSSIPEPKEGASDKDMDKYFESLNAKLDAVRQNHKAKVEELQKTVIDLESELQASQQREPALSAFLSRVDKLDDEVKQMIEDRQFFTNLEELVLHTNQPTTKELLGEHMQHASPRMKIIDFPEFETEDTMHLRETNKGPTGTLSADNIRNNWRFETPEEVASRNKWLYKSRTETVYEVQRRIYEEHVSLLRKKFRQEWEARKAIADAKKRTRLIELTEYRQKKALEDAERLRKTLAEERLKQEKQRQISEAARKQREKTRELVLEKVRQRQRFQLAYLRNEREKSWILDPEKDLDESIFQRETVINGFWPPKPKIEAPNLGTIASEEEYNMFMYHKLLKDSGLDPEALTAPDETARISRQWREETRARLERVRDTLQASIRAMEADVADLEAQLEGKKPFDPSFVPDLKKASIPFQFSPLRNNPDTVEVATRKNAERRLIELTGTLLPRAQGKLKATLESIENINRRLVDPAASSFSSQTSVNAQ